MFSGRCGYAMLVLFVFFAVVAVLPGSAIGGNAANFILYNHHTADEGEREIMLMNDFGQDFDGTRYAAQMVELEIGITDRWTT